MTNEHPDMHGNPCDAPFLCEWCGRDFPEDNAYGVAASDELLFCSGECAESWEEDRRDDGDVSLSFIPQHPTGERDE